MQHTIYDWLGHTWVALRAEGRPQLDVTSQTNDIFQRLDAELSRSALSLDHTMRTRLWARTREGRDKGSRVRALLLTGLARSASSSFIAPDYFDSDAEVAVELWAMQPAQPGAGKTLVEYDPPIVPLRYLSCESALVLSGVTSVLPTLADQVGEILVAIEGTLAQAGAAWGDVVKLSCHLHRSQSLEELRSLLAGLALGAHRERECGFVDGYSTPGKLVEVEVSGRLPV